MAVGPSTFNYAGGAVKDLFDIYSIRARMQGLKLEAANYKDASRMSLQNAEFAKENTQIQSAQETRQIFQGLGKTEATIAGAGFDDSGSGLDLLRSGAEQGALEKALIERQGQITEAGYETQAKAYSNMAAAALKARDAAKMQIIGNVIGAATKIGAAAFTL